MKQHNSLLFMITNDLKVINMEEEMKNPDADFVLQGRKTPLKERDEEYLTNSQKTLTSKNLSASLNFSGGNFQPVMTESRSVPNISDLEKSINELKLELTDLNRSLASNLEQGGVFVDDDLPVQKFSITRHSENYEDPELTYLTQRHDNEAVSHLPPDDSQWFRDPKHKTRPLGDYPTMQDLGVTRRSVSPINRSTGRLGSEIATKDITGKLTPLDISLSESTFPVRLTAPHIVGVRSLLPPQYPVRGQDKERAKSPKARTRSVDIGLARGRSLSAGRVRGRSRSRGRSRDRSMSPHPVWMPTSRHANASAKAPPPFGKKKSINRGRSPARRRPATASGHRENMRSNLSKSLPITRHSLPSTKTLSTYRRPRVQPQPGHMEMSFLEAADRIDTRRALVNNSPYQQQLSRLRLERLRVEEEYLLQLKRESELERIRGPKPKWYEMKGPNFHYECNKNTTLHRSRDQWGGTMRYRDELLRASKEFTENMNGPTFE